MTPQCNGGRGVVAELARVDDRLANRADKPEADQGKVVAVVATTAALPPLTHGARLVGTVDCRGRPVERVAAGDNLSAMLLAGEIYGHPIDLTRILDRLAKDPQARYAPVGED